MCSKLAQGKKDSERGASLVMVAVGMVFILGMLGLGIDLCSLYVGRTQAQRTADAAALAGAEAFVDSQYTAGVTSAGDAQTLATERALSIGNQNLIAGVNPNMSAGDLSFDFSNPQDPKITAVASRTRSHGNPMPTYFMKIFGVQAVDVSATATAEAYSPKGGPVPVGPACVKPWLYPNCDFGKAPVFTTSLGNPNCPAVTAGVPPYYPYLVDPSTLKIESPGYYPTGSIGEYITLKSGNPGTEPTSSQFFAVQLPQGNLSCPSCANNGGGSGGSASNYANLIACCNEISLSTGETLTVAPNTGNMVGPTGQAVDCLINESNNTGQDIISWCPKFPACLPASSSGYTITGGANNPFYPGQQISTSDSSSVVAVPIYSGYPLCSGGSTGTGCSNTIEIYGFLEVFLTGEDKNNNNTVYGYVLDIVSSVSNTANPVNAGTPIPVRLIHP